MRFDDDLEVPLIEVLAEHTADPAQRAALHALTDDEQYRTHVREPNLSVLDLLDRYPACALPFPVFLDLLPADRKSVV